jgi:hypothetical protein
MSAHLTSGPEVFYKTGVTPIAGLWAAPWRAAAGTSGNPQCQRDGGRDDRRQDPGTRTGSACSTIGVRPASSPGLSPGWVWIQEQTPPLQVVLPTQSELVQQLAAEMQALPHSLNPTAQVEQTPAPLHIVFPGQAAGAGSTQLPPAQVPAPTRTVPEQVGLPQVPVG